MTTTTATYPPHHYYHYLYRYYDYYCHLSTTPLLPLRISLRQLLLPPIHHTTITTTYIATTTTTATYPPHHYYHYVYRYDNYYCHLSTTPLLPLPISLRQLLLPPIHQINIFARVKETKQVYAETEDFRLRKNKIVVEVSVYHYIIILLHHNMITS